MRHALSWICVVVLVLACTPGEQTRTIVVTGSSTVAPILGDIAQRYEQHTEGIRVDVQTGGSSRGIADVRRDVADIGMVSRALSDAEDDLDDHLLARDGLGMIVHRDNPVTALTQNEVRTIYRGAVSRWTALGGQDREITVVHKADGRATQTLFLAMFSLAATNIAADVIVGDNAQGIHTVAATPGAIGYVSIGAAMAEARTGTPIRLTALDGRQPSLQAVAEGRLAHVRELNMVTHGPIPDHVQAFLDYATSAAIHDLIEAHYVVPISG